MPQVKVPIEYTAVIAIVMLITIIVAYAIGVERGKTLALVHGDRSSLKSSMPMDDGKPLLDVAMVEKQAEELMEKAETPPAPPVLSKAEGARTTTGITGKAQQVASNQTQTNKPLEGDAALYALQLASTKNEEYAKIEVSKLKDKGFEASISRRGDWFKIYVPYSTMEEAQKAQKKLSDDYKDSLIVKTKQ